MDEVGIMVGGAFHASNTGRVNEEVICEIGRAPKSPGRDADAGVLRCWASDVRYEVEGRSLMVVFDEVTQREAVEEQRHF